MANGWTSERRARQSAAIRNWRPWERSTGPRTLEGKACTSRNGFKGGQREQLRALGRELNDALNVLDTFLISFADDSEPALRERYADALLDKAGTLGDLERWEEASEIYDEVVKRFDGSQSLSFARRLPGRSR